MRGGTLATRRAIRLLGVGALAAVTAGAGSCAAAGNSSVTATGKTLTIYASVPPGTPNAADVVAAEQLALRQGGTQVGGYRLVLRILNGRKIADNARTAIEDTSAIAYIGELAPGTSADSVGITNAEDLLQVSPTETTAPAHNDYESLKTYGGTFFRTVVRIAPNEASAAVSEMKKLGVRRLLVADDGSSYGVAIAGAVRKDAQSSSLSLAPSPAAANGAFFGAGPSPAAARTLQAWSGANPRLKLFASSGAASALTSTHSVFVPADPSAVAALGSGSGQGPAPVAVLAYQAVAAVDRAIHQIGAAANDRSKVVGEFFANGGASSNLRLYQLRAGKLVPSR